MNKLDMAIDHLAPGGCFINVQPGGMSTYTADLLEPFKSFIF